MIFTTSGPAWLSIPRHSGSRVSTAASTSDIVSPSKSLCPVIISHSNAPRPQMSARRSTTLPRACSGAMYAAVPRTTPAAVACVVIVGDMETLESRLSIFQALANPKSSTLTMPSGRIRTLAGLRSRCTIPRPVGHLQRLGDLNRNRDRLVNRDRPAVDHLVEALTLDQLHHQHMRAVEVLESVQGRDIGVVEARQHLGFTLEAHVALWIVRKILRQYLERDVAAE